MGFFLTHFIPQYVLCTHSYITKLQKHLAGIGGLIRI